MGKANLACKELPDWGGSVWGGGQVEVDNTDAKDRQGSWSGPGETEQRVGGGRK